VSHTRAAEDLMGARIAWGGPWFDQRVHGGEVPYEQKGIEVPFGLLIPPRIAQRLFGAAHCEWPRVFSSACNRRTFRGSWGSRPEDWSWTRSGERQLYILGASSVQLNPGRNPPTPIHARYPTLPETKKLFPTGYRHVMWYSRPRLRTADSEAST
jgi:hypothetical protein